MKILKDQIKMTISREQINGFGLKWPSKSFFGTTDHGSDVRFAKFEMMDLTCL